jgi:hypothetical protein
VFQKPPSDPQLDAAINAIYLDLQHRPPHSDEYARDVTQLSKLYALKDHHSKNRVSPDTWANIGAYLAGIVIIVGYEKSNVITSKALPLMKKLF